MPCPYFLQPTPYLIATYAETKWASLCRGGNSLCREGKSLCHGGKPLRRSGKSVCRTGNPLCHRGKSLCRGGKSLYRGGNPPVGEGGPSIAEGSPSAGAGSPPAERGEQLLSPVFVFPPYRSAAKIPINRDALRRALLLVLRHQLRHLVRHQKLGEAVELPPLRNLDLHREHPLGPPPLSEHMPGFFFHLDLGDGHI